MTFRRKRTDAAAPPAPVKVASLGPQAVLDAFPTLGWHSQALDERSFLVPFPLFDDERGPASLVCEVEARDGEAPLLHFLAQAMVSFHPSDGPFLLALANEWNSAWKLPAASVAEREDGQSEVRLFGVLPAGAGTTVGQAAAWLDDVAHRAARFWEAFRTRWAAPACCRREPAAPTPRPPLPTPGGDARSCGRPVGGAAPVSPASRARGRRRWSSPTGRRCWSPSTPRGGRRATPTAPAPRRGPPRSRLGSPPPSLPGGSARSHSPSCTRGPGQRHLLQRARGPLRRRRALRRRPRRDPAQGVPRLRRTGKRPGRRLR